MNSSSRSQPNYEITEADMRSSSKLNRRQLLILASGALTAPLPPRLFDDPAEVTITIKDFNGVIPTGASITVTLDPGHSDFLTTFVNGVDPRRCEVTWNGHRGDFIGALWMVHEVFIGGVTSIVGTACLSLQ